MNLTNEPESLKIDIEIQKDIYLYISFVTLKYWQLDLFGFRMVCKHSRFGRMFDVHYLVPIFSVLLLIASLLEAPLRLVAPSSAQK